MRVMLPVKLHSRYGLEIRSSGWKTGIHSPPPMAVDAVPGRLDGEDLFQLGQFLRHLRGQIARLAPVLIQVVELPFRGPKAEAIQPSW
jgi:hypothetical protein